MKQKLLGLLFLFCMVKNPVKAENAGTWTAGVSAASANTDVVFSYTLNYNLWLNRYTSVYFGGIFTHGYSDNGGEWKGASGSVYYVPDRLKTRHVNAQAGILLYSPSVLKSGLYGGGQFFFDVIPFNFVSLKKEVARQGTYETTEDVERFRFNRFSPGAFAEVGLYHDFCKNTDHPFRVSIGYGYGYYDPFSAYRNTVVDGVRVGEKMLSNDHVYQKLVLRITGL